MRTFHRWVSLFYLVISALLCAPIGVALLVGAMKQGRLGGLIILAGSSVVFNHQSRLATHSSGSHLSPTQVVVQVQQFGRLRTLDVPISSSASLSPIPRLRRNNLATLGSVSQSSSKSPARRSAFRAPSEHLTILEFLPYYFWGDRADSFHRCCLHYVDKESARLTP